MRQGRRFRFGETGRQRGRLIGGVCFAANAPFRLSQVAQPLAFVTRM